MSKLLGECNQYCCTTFKSVEVNNTTFSDWTFK